MQRTSINLHAKTLALLALALLMLAALGAAGAVAAPVPSKRSAATSESATRYWTAARMRAAEPLDATAEGTSASPPPSSAAPSGPPSYVPAAPAGDPGGADLQAGTATAERLPGLGGSSEEVPDPSAVGIRAHGKVFFTVPGEGDFVCSGTAVNSRNRSVVWTAGHCVFDAGRPSDGYTNRFSTHFIFVPAYRDGNAPFGEWAARRLATTEAWKGQANLKYDLGAAVVRRHLGRRLQRVVGARGIGFNQPRGEPLQALGYPQELPFDGRREYRCSDAPRSGDPRNGYPGPAPMRISCDMTAGSSGGGWIVGGTLVSVTSYGYANELNTLYGPYMSAAAKKLYKSVRGAKRRTG